MAMFLALDANKIIATIELLKQRIEQRFPGAELGAVAGDLLAVARDAEAEAASLTQPNRVIQIAVGFLAAAFLSLIVIALINIPAPTNTEATNILQTLDAVANLVVLAGALLIFLVTLQRRLGRHKGSRVNQLRSLVHVIDMHQLTKDPSLVLGHEQDTAASPKRDMTPFELGRYLDYCSEMLSFTGKVAALYAQDLDDPVVVEGVNDIEMLATNLSRKIWQKIAIYSRRCKCRPRCLRNDRARRKGGSSGAKLDPVREHAARCRRHRGAGASAQTGALHLREAHLQRGRRTADRESRCAGRRQPSASLLRRTYRRRAGRRREAWRHPPFAANLLGGVLYGRGAADMKGAIACFVAAALDYIRLRGRELDGSISFLITGDEEGPAINGTRQVLRWMEKKGQRMDHCLVGEPTNSKRLGEAIKIGRRGSLNGRIRVSGVQGHVAYPHLASNPIKGLINVLARLYDSPLDYGSAHFSPSNLEVTSINVGNPCRTSSRQWRRRASTFATTTDTRPNR